MSKIKSQKIKSVNDQTMIVTLDIGKGSHYGYFRAPDGQDVEPFAFYNTYDSFHSFWKKLSRFKKAHGCRQVLVGFESTGPYAEPITHFLKQQPVTLVQINPMHSKRVRELTGNSPNKTDRKDPRVIADVIMLGHALRVVIPQGSSAHLRRLTQARERAIRDRTAIVNQLQHLLFVIFPEFLKVIKKISCKTGLYLLRHYPSRQAIAALGEQQLSRIIKRVSRGKMGQWHAEQLCQAAQASVGINEGQESIVEEIGHLVDKIKRENDFIDRVECQMRVHLEQIPYSRYLLSLPGVGLITVAGLIGEVGDFRQYGTVAEITKLAGLDLFEVSSGKHKGRRRISKRGRPLMRKLLYFAAINAVKSTGTMHRPYTRMLERGMPKIKALVAISRKLLRVMYALARDQEMYMENFDHNRYRFAA
ncbi:MAG: IS110 family transposase [Proteobacteria bacterium]|nr:IS110 family transposase [Pseudomonadota bacterium]